MATRPHPAGYRCAKALRELGFESSAIADSLRLRLALDTGEIEAVLSFPVTPPDGTPLVDGRDVVVDLTRPVAEQPRRRRSDVDAT
ncbi:MAG TPA: hypothetical protein VFV00_08050 [Acidimicrobiales bacterium]|nr:hypothetical protein [Acidimicrobiales bacterium]